MKYGTGRTEVAEVPGRKLREKAFPRWRAAGPNVQTHVVADH